MSACVSTTPKLSSSGSDTSNDDAATIQSAQKERPSVDQSSLSSELIYDTLAGEIASQRGHNETAFTHAFRAAQQSRQASAAERATQLALQAKLKPEAMEATQLWLELDPNSLGAHQIAALLTASLDQRAKTVFHLHEVVRIANQKGQNGYLKAAAIAEKSGTPDQSLDLMQQVIPADTRDPDALYSIALLANQAKQFQLAEQSIRRALQSKPSWPKGTLLLSRTLIVQKRTEEGMQILEQAVQQAPDNTSLRLTYAQLLLENQQLEESLKQFEVLNQLNPKNSDILFALGIISSELTHYESAEAYFQRLLKMGKKRAEAHFHLGLIAKKTGNLDQAFQHFYRVDGSNQADARIQMARILAEKGKLKEAQELLQQLRIKLPQHDIKLYLIEADLLRDDQLYALADAVYNRGLELHPDNPDLLYARALNAADLGEIGILERDLKKIIAQQPDHADALNALGYTLADQTDRLEEAKIYIQKALALKPNSPAILDSMGWVEYRLGNFAQAVKYLQQAASFSQDAEIASHLGEVLWRMDQKDQALEVWRKANELEPENRYIKPVMQRLGVE